jgi:hypothetical protein
MLMATFPRFPKEERYDNRRTNDAIGAEMPETDLGGDLGRLGSHAGNNDRQGSPLGRKGTQVHPLGRQRQGSRLLSCQHKGLWRWRV